MAKGSLRILRGFLKDFVREYFGQISLWVEGKEVEVEGGMTI